MEYNYILSGLSCPHCAEKIEKALNDDRYINQVDLSLENQSLRISSEQDQEYLDSIIKETVHRVESGIKIINQNSNRELVTIERQDHQSDKTDDYVDVDYLIKGLDCANCAAKVERHLNNHPDIERAVLNFNTEKLKLKTRLSKEELENLIAEVEEGVSLETKINKQPKINIIKDNILLIDGFVCFVGAFFLSGWLRTAVFIGAYLLVGHDVLIKAFKNILRRDIFDENFLMSLASLAALFLGDYAEGVSVMLFYSVGELLQDYAVNRSRRSIADLMDIKSEVAYVRKDNQIVKVTPEEVNIGETIVVRVGQRVPLDGILVKGRANLDLSSLTGESLPQRINIGDEVLSGSINLNEVIDIKVTRTYENSTVAKIIELVENSAAKKAPVEKFITRFARIYTPIVVAAAVFVAGLMPLITGQPFSVWLYRAATFLVVSCPCALVISVPLGLFSGIGRASKEGVLIKGGNYLDILRKVDVFVFDKTGTITKGTFDVVEITGEDNLLEIAALAESGSNHPIARSIVRKYNQIIDNARISDYQEIPGKGIAALIDGSPVYLGNYEFVKAYASFKPVDKLGSVIYVVYQDKYLGYLVVADTIKEGAAKALEELKRQGVKQTVMLTGDNQNIAQVVSQEVGLDQYYANLLPQDKVKQIESLINKDNQVAFVGDGVNDAPVLARSDLGIAMGGIGSDVAIEAADIVLMKDNLSAISSAISIARVTHLIVIENIVFALGIKLIILALAFFGIANMWLGVFADVGVALIAIVNSMRVLKIKI